MGKTRAVITIVILALFSLSIFCCCFSNISHADQLMADTTNVPECHAQAASEEAPSHKECDCPQVISLAIQKSANNIQLTQLDTFKLDDIFLNSLSAQQILDDSIDALAYQSSHQKFKDAIPLYLKNSILRL